MFYDTETKYSNGCRVKRTEYWAQSDADKKDYADLASYRCKSLTIKVEIAPDLLPPLRGETNDPTTAALQEIADFVSTTVGKLGTPTASGDQSAQPTTQVKAETPSV